jgi:hypothetical protein
MEDAVLHVLARAIVLAVIGTLTGCGGGVPDLSGTGGTLDNPHVLPEENQPGVDQGIEDYLRQRGHWKFPYDALTLLVEGGALPAYGDIVYDTVLDRWTVTVGASTYVLSPAGGTYENLACGVDTCVELSSYDNDSLTSQYGTFGAIHVDDGTNVSVAQIYYGLKTPSADMPTGSYTYNGDFAGEIVLDDGTTYDAESTATMNVNFGLSTIGLSSTGDVTDDSSSVVGEYELSGTAVISGNSYSGNVATAIYTPTGDDSISFNSNGMIEGAFYGPAADETAGAIATESGGGDLLYGGFWGER